MLRPCSTSSGGPSHWPTPACRTRIRCSGDGVTQIELPGVPLGAFAGSTYDELSFDLAAGEVFVFCSDGVSEANDALGREFGAERLLEVVSKVRGKTAREIVDAHLRRGPRIPRRHARPTTT